VSHSGVMQNGAVAGCERHIEYRDGPAGRRAALVGGPDVWVVVTTEPDIAERPARVAAVAEYLGLDEERVAAAFAYYDDHPHEVEEWTELNRRAVEAARTERQTRSGPSHR